MKTLRIADYIAAGGDGKWLDNAIAFHTGWFNRGTPPFSHSEIWMKDEIHGFGGGNSVWAGEMFTSTLCPPAKGTVIRPASTVLKHPERWYITEIDVADDLYRIARNWAKIRVACNGGYDRMTIGSFFWPWGRFGSKDKEQAICSERCYQFLCECGIFTDKTKCPSPRRLCSWLADMGYITKPLVAA